MLTGHSKCTSQVRRQEVGRRGRIAQYCSMCPFFLLALCTVDFLTTHLSSYVALKDVVSMTIPS